MNAENGKCVIVLDASLPPGIIANTAAILGVTMGTELPEVVGGGVRDGTGRLHAGIIQFPIPVLKGTGEILWTLRERLYEPAFSDLVTVDFTSLAQGCRTYGEFVEKMEFCPGEELRYLGIAICGEKKRIDQLTGSLPLLR